MISVLVPGTLFIIFGSILALSAYQFSYYEQLGNPYKLTDCNIYNGKVIYKDSLYTPIFYAIYDYGIFHINGTGYSGIYDWQYEDKEYAKFILDYYMGKGKCYVSTDNFHLFVTDKYGPLYPLFGLVISAVLTFFFLIYTLIFSVLKWCPIKIEGETSLYSDELNESIQSY